jgi:hypothetical protein
MRRILIVLAVALFGTHAVCAAERSELPGRAVQGIREMDWVKRAPASTLMRIATDASLAEVAGPRPVALIETNYYTFLPGEPLQVRLTVDPNGYGAPVTLYLYWENRTTGERRYYNTSGGMLAAGQQSDLFGSTSGVIPVFVPALGAELRSERRAGRIDDRAGGSDRPVPMGRRAP